MSKVFLKLVQEISFAIGDLKAYLQSYVYPYNRKQKMETADNNRALEDSPSLAGANILVMEDEPIILMALATSFKRAGATVLRALTVSKAHDLLSEKTVDVAVLDVEMGRYETCNSVAETLRSRKIPFCLYSGDLDEASELMIAFRVPFVKKPTNTKVILKQVSNLLV